MARVHAHKGRLPRSPGSPWLGWLLALCVASCVYAPTDGELNGRSCVSIGSNDAAVIRFASGRFSIVTPTGPDGGVAQSGIFRVCQPPQLLYLMSDDGQCGCYEIEGFGSALTEFDFEQRDSATCMNAAIACTGLPCEHPNSDPGLAALVPAGRFSCPRNTP